MHTSYRVTLCDRTGRRIGVLAPRQSTALQHATVLNGGGTFSMTPSLRDPLISGVARRRNLRAWASEIVVERLSGWGETGVVWAGPVQTPHADLDSEQLSVDAATLWAWLGERSIEERHAYAAHEQTEIAADLITAYTTGLGPNGDIRLRIAASKTGQRVTQLYLPADNKTVDTAVGDLATATNGFDFDIDFARDPMTGRLIRTWRSYFPRKGRTINRTLSSGRGGLRAFSIEDATQVATRVRGSGQLTLTARAADTVEAEFGIHSRAISLTDAPSKSLLQRQVDDYLRNRTPPVEIVSFQYRVSKARPYGMIKLGDSVPIKVDRGWAAYDAPVRVIGLSTSVDSLGVETVSCTAASVPGGLT